MPRQPNFIFILTDDQDRILGKSGYTSYGSMEIMPNLQEKLIDEGAVIDNFLVNTRRPRALHYYIYAFAYLIPSILLNKHNLR